LIDAFIFGIRVRHVSPNGANAHCPSPWSGPPNSGCGTADHFKRFDARLPPNGVFLVGDAP